MKRPGILPPIILSLAIVSASLAEGAEIPRDGGAGPEYMRLTEEANSNIEKGDKRAALRLLRKAKSLNIDHPDAHFLLGRLYFLTRNYDEAISEFSFFKEKMKAVLASGAATNRLYIERLYYIANVYFTLRMYEESRGEMEVILKLDPKEQRAYYNLGVYYYVHRHSRPDAYRLFTKTIEIDPTTDTAKSARYAIEFIRTNPDSRIAPDFSFINK